MADSTQTPDSIAQPGDREVDVVVVGLGPGGESAATALADAGLSVVGVEKHLVGGECPFYGCIPSKMMIRASDSLAEARRAGELAGEVQVTPDWGRVAARVSERATSGWDDTSHVTSLEAAGVEVVRGRGRLAGPRRVVVEPSDGSAAVSYVARRGVLVNPGTSPATPPIDGLARTPFLTNREVMRLGELPASLIVIGGGPIGCELAQVFARFGSRVTVLEVGPRILGPEEPESSELLRGRFAEEGIDVREGVQIDRVDHAGSEGGDFVVRLGGGEELRSTQLLVAAGRRTNLSDLGLDTVGLDPQARTLEPDERMRVAEGLWAIGDVTGKGAFTHVSMYQGAIAVRDLLGQDGPWADYRAVSRVTFTDPEVGSVGLGESQARDQGLNVRVGLTQLPDSSRGWLHQLGNDGLIKVVADADRGVLVGASSVGPSGGEVLGLLAAAVHAEVPIETLRGMHFAYPTFHRAIATALDEVAG